MAPKRIGLDSSRTARAKPSAPPSDEDRLQVLVAALFVAAALVFACWLSWQRFLDLDELEHLNGAYFLSQGERLYGTFFENHPPGQALLLQPVVRLAPDAFHMIDFGRALSFALSLLSLGCVAALARRLAGPCAALLAPLLLLTHSIYLAKTIEVRPDVAATLCLAAALLLLARGVESERTRASAMGAGLLALGMLFTPKIVYASAGAMVGALLAHWDSHSYGAGPDSASRERGRAKGRRRALAHLGAMALGGLGVAAVALSLLQWTGSLEGFFSDVIAANLEISVGEVGGFLALYGAELLVDNGPSTFLGLAGMVILYRSRATLRSGPQHSGPQYGLQYGLQYVLLASFGFALAGLFHLQAPLRQYYMSFLPQLCIAAAVALLAVHHWLLTRVHQRARRQVPTALSALLLAALLAVTVAPAVSRSLNQYGTQDQQRRRLAKVLELTRPGDRVFDCWSGTYLSRLPAFYFFYLNYDIQPIVPPARLRDELPQRLLAPDVRVAIWDSHCAALPPAVHRVVARHYRAVAGYPLLRVRRADGGASAGGSQRPE
ncbi:MAG: glycosyltransferase family 39 protein [Deltaproteobacteria bacterium]|nr:glycosyltransferase family 39 protein [Deltaproteobacteria bacterium]